MEETAQKKQKKKRLKERQLPFSRNGSCIDLSQLLLSPIPEAALSSLHASYTTAFDIGREYDLQKSLNTSIKCCKSRKNGNETIYLADARRIFSQTEPFRLLLGLYRQVGNLKTVHTIVEYLIDEHTLAAMKGGIRPEEVAAFHEQLKTYPAGMHRQARDFARARKRQFSSPLRLNPKIDSKNQRRLQCSIPRQVLEEMLPPENIRIYTRSYKEITLPVHFESQNRRFNKAEPAAPAPVPAPVCTRDKAPSTPSLRM